MNKLSILFCLLLFCLPVFGQEVEMADGMRSEGKIYVVVAILISILLGLIAYLISLDRKVSRLEKRQQEKSKS